MLRGGTASREHHHQSNGAEKGNGSSVVHLWLPMYWFQTFRLLQARRRCRCLTASITHTEPSVCTLPNIQSRCLALSITHTELFICTVTHMGYPGFSVHAMRAELFLVLQAYGLGKRCQSAASLEDGVVGLFHAHSMLSNTG